MRISIGCDHRGLALKEQLLPLLKSLGHEVSDEGTNQASSVDYPDFAAAVAGKVSKQTADRGILVCGTGVGMVSLLREELNASNLSRTVFKVVNFARVSVLNDLLPLAGQKLS